MTNLIPHSAASYIGPRTDANAAAYDGIDFVLRRAQVVRQRNERHRLVQEFRPFQTIGEVLVTVPGLSDWRIWQTDKCAKMYEIDGRYYGCYAKLCRNGEIWSAELFWPDRYGNQPCLPGTSLLEAAQAIEEQIEILRACDHGCVESVEV